MKYSELHKLLREAGCYVYRNGKRHPIWINPKTGVLFETGYHESEEVKRGTLHSIMKLSGLDLL